MMKTHNNMNNHLYKDVHDKNQKWIVIHKKMCMVKTHKNMISHSYKDVHDKNPY